jgi:hypothetical protein
MFQPSNEVRARHQYIPVNRRSLAPGPTPFTATRRFSWKICDILLGATSGLSHSPRNSDAPRSTPLPPYRPDGWTVRQVVHHVPDSHLNAYTRFKLGLTEDTPTIKPYDEAKWAQLEDSRSTPIATSLALLDAVHDRWLRVLRAMSSSDFARTLNHPENGVMNLDQMLALYEWHGRHHVAHVTNLRSRNGW